MNHMMSRHNYVAIVLSYKIRTDCKAQNNSRHFPEKSTLSGHIWICMEEISVWGFNELKTEATDYFLTQCPDNSSYAHVNFIMSLQYVIPSFKSIHTLYIGNIAIAT